MATSPGQPVTCLPSVALQLQLRPVQLSQGAVTMLPMVRGLCPWSVSLIAPAIHSLCDLGHVSCPFLVSVSFKKWASSPQACCLSSI